MTLRQLSNLVFKENAVKNFDKIYSYFANKTTDDMIEDPGDILVETIGQLESEKQLGKALQFINLLQEKHPEMYLNEFNYIDDLLIKYYAFHGNEKMLSKSFENFIKYPIKDFDQYMHCFNIILFYGHNDILRKAVKKNITTVARSGKLPPGAENDLILCKFMLLLSDYYRTKKFDKDEFTHYMSKHKFDANEAYVEFVRKGFYEPFPSKDIIFRVMEEDIRKGLTLLFMYFVKHMYGKGMGACISGRIWYLFTLFWPENLSSFKDKERYFNVAENKFEEYLNGLADLYMEHNTAEMVALLWGSVYVYDFLKNGEIINDETYDSFSKTARKLKCKFIGQSPNHLWQYDFVHRWAKADGITEKEFTAEHSIFKKSYALKSCDFSDFIPEIEKELQDLGDLAAQIIEFGEIEVREHKLKMAEIRETLLREHNIDIDNLRYEYEDEYEDEDEDDYYDDDVFEPPTVITRKKIGRNEKCPCGSGKKYKKCCGK